MNILAFLKEYRRLLKEDQVKADIHLKSNQPMRELAQSPIELIALICEEKELLLESLVLASLEEIPEIQDAMVEHVKAELLTKVIGKLGSSVSKSLIELASIAVEAVVSLMLETQRKGL